MKPSQFSKEHYIAQLYTASDVDGTRVIKHIVVIGAGPKTSTEVQAMIDEMNANSSSIVVLGKELTIGGLYFINGDLDPSNEDIDVLNFLRDQKTAEMTFE